MYGSEPPTVSDAEAVESSDLTITDAARAFGTGRRVIRSRLHAGEFPNAAKDAQGFWRIPEADLRAAGLAPAGEATPTADLDELRFLRIEVVELRHRVEHAEALLEAERRLSEERARALEAERATVEALYRQSGISRPTPKAPEPSRADWQASMRAARERDLRMRAERDSENRQHAPRPDPRPEPRSEAAASDAARAETRGSGNTVTIAETATTEAADTPPTGNEPERRHRWRRR